MKITVITGSPHRKGTSALLADRFIEGAGQAGHEVFRFDAAFERVAPCLGCDRCGIGSSNCVQDDSMNKLKPALLEADVVAFVTPLYYFGMSAQLKTVLDRFYGINYKLMGSGKRAVLMATAYDDRDWTMTDLVAHFRTVVKYLKWQEAGILLATGCGTRGDIERTEYPERAFRMGRSIGRDPV